MQLRAFVDQDHRSNYGQPEEKGAAEITDLGLLRRHFRNMRAEGL